MSPSANWIVTITPKGVLADQLPDNEQEEILRYLANETEDGSSTIEEIGINLKFLNIRALVSKLVAQKLVTVKYIQNISTRLYLD